MFLITTCSLEPRGWLSQYIIILWDHGRCYNDSGSHIGDANLRLESELRRAANVVVIND